MKIVNPNRAVRILGIVICSIFACGFRAALGFERPEIQQDPGLMAMAIVIPACLFVVVLSCYPWVRLTEQGVEVRYIFIKRFFAWSDIAQAGIMEDSGRGEYYQYPMVLILKHSKHTINRGFLFKLCNWGNLVLIPGSPEIKNAVSVYYGTLDFDESLGRAY